MLNGHGGNIYTAARQFGWDPSEIIDMSSNINPLGPPAGLLDYLKENIMSLTKLPEVDSAETVKYFADYMQIEPERVLAGNGTTQFIYALPRVLESENVLILGPTYSDYADACTLQTIKSSFAIAEEANDFLWQAERTEEALEGKDTVFICNPNNPTGRFIPFDELQLLCLAHPNIYFIIDESYLPFVANAEKETMVNARLENVIVLSSLSKIFKVPGLRIGFIISSQKTIEKMKKFQLPWSVNSLAQVTMHFLVNQKSDIDQFVQNSRNFFDTQRQNLIEEIKSKSDLKPFPSCTTFVLAKLPAGISSHEAWKRLIKDKILIRNCSNFYGLSDRFIRISLKMSETNRMLADKLTAMFPISKNNEHNSEARRVA